VGDAVEGAIGCLVVIDGSVAIVGGLTIDEQCVCWRSNVATVEMETIGATPLRRPSSCQTARNDFLAEYFLMQARNTDGVEYWHARVLRIHP